MLVNTLISPDRISCHENIVSKKRALEKISEHLATGQPGLNENAIFDKLLERERLGSTGLGLGVAIPHCRLAGTQQAIIAIMTLADGIDYDATDGQPVDILFALLVPEDCNETHLKILANAAEMFSDSQFCENLRSSTDQQQLYELISNWQPDSLSA